MLNFAAIGTGVFGVKRAKAIQECKNAKPDAMCDKNSENAERAQKILDEVTFLSYGHGEFFKMTTLQIANLHQI